MTFKEETKDDLISNFIAHIHSFQDLGGHSFGHILDKHFQEKCSLQKLSSKFNYVHSLYFVSNSFSIPLEISQGKTLNINHRLEDF
jgi:hypothetical protein